MKHKPFGIDLFSCKKIAQFETYIFAIYTGTTPKTLFHCEKYVANLHEVQQKFGEYIFMRSKNASYKIYYGGRGEGVQNRLIIMTTHNL